MRIFAILSLLGVIAAAAFMSTVGARPASAQPVTTITVTKICTGVPDPDAEFLMVLQENGVTTNDVEDATLEVGCGQNVVFMFDEAPGDDYDVVEEVLQGNVVSTLSGCQDIDPVENENVSCTIENVLGNDNTIVVVKDAGGANAEFDFTITAPGGAFDCEASFSLNDVNSAADDEAFSGCLADIDYTIAETDGPNGWDLVDVQCSDNGDVSYSDTANGVTVTFNEYGVEVICTFYNVQEDDGSITIIKDTNPETSGISFDFDSDLGDFDLADDESVQFTGLADVDFSFIENPPAGWVLVDITCNAADYNTNIPSRGLVVDLQPGEDVTCTFVNEPVEDNGSITIIKETNPDTNDVFFDFDGDLGDFDLEDDDSITFVNLAPGTYTVIENEPSGWSLVDIICNNTDVSFSGEAVIIDLDPGEHITCEFINQQLSVPTATPTKTPIVIIPAATATKTPVSPPVVGPIAPPSAGDGGLMDGDGLPWLFGILSIVAAGGTAWVFIQRRISQSGRS